MHWSQCSNCQHSLSEDHSQGMLVCTECGTIQESHIAYPQTMNTDIRMIHNIPPSVSQKHGLINIREKSFKMKWIHRQIDEKNLVHHKTRKHFSCMCQGYFSETIINEATNLFNELCNRKLYRGSVRVGMIACSLMWACKIHNVPRTVQEISNITKTKTKDINKSNKIFQNVMQSVLPGQQKRMTHEDIVRRYCSEIQLEKKDHNKLVKAVTALINKNHSFFDGKKITSIVVVVIFFLLDCMNIQISKKEMSRQFTVSIVTINKLLKDLNTYYSKEETMLLIQEDRHHPMK